MLVCSLSDIKKYMFKVVLILLLVILVGCKEATLYKNVEEVEANLMASVLLREGIDAERMANADGTYNIIIKDEKLFSQAIDALTLRGFPRVKFDNLCTIFKGDGMVSTPIEQKARYTCAKAQELAGSLSQLDGISMARVHLVLSETDPISRQVKPASSSVMIKYKSGIDIDTLLPKIKQLVSFGVEGLPYQNVSVMFSEEVGRKEDMIARAYQKTDTSKQVAMPDLLFPEENNPGGQNMIVLYLVMILMTIGMVMIIFFMLRMKSSASGTLYDQSGTKDNLPVEF